MRHLTDCETLEELQNDYLKKNSGFGISFGHFTPHLGARV